MSSEDFNLTGVCSENELNDSMDELDQTSNTLLDDGLDDDQDIKAGGNQSPDFQKGKPRKENRKCTVCGDRALGYNFDAITCESCKAFFRRNANKSKHPRCMFQRTCVIDSNTRRFCSACRLTKCFAVGMKKEMILGDDERQKRVMKVKQNREKKLVQLQKQTGAVIGIVNPSLEGKRYDEPADLGSPSSSMDNMFRVKMEKRASNCHSQEPMPWTFSANIHIEQAMDTEDFRRRQLGSHDLALISVISEAYINSFGSTADEIPMQVENTSLEGLMNHIGQLVRILIRFAKKVADFTSLPQNAQVALLKGSSLDCITWRSAQMFDSAKGKWINDEGTEIPMQVLNAAFDQVDRSIQLEHVQLISSIKDLVGSDLTMVSLVQCVILFTPEYSAPGARALTATVQDKYITLLKHYMEAHNNWDVAFDKFSKLMSYIAATKLYATKHSKAFSQCDSDLVEPLLKEIFDLGYGGAFK